MARNVDTLMRNGFDISRYHSALGRAGPGVATVWPMCLGVVPLTEEEAQLPSRGDDYADTSFNYWNQGAVQDDCDPPREDQHKWRGCRVTSLVKMEGEMDGMGWDESTSAYRF